jgi:peptidyl-dipeptidase Dcp
MAAMRDVLNPLLADWTGPLALPPFADITPDHFRSAFENALADEQAEIDAIGANTDPVSFENTALALDRSGELLTRVARVFFNLAAAETSEGLQAVERDIAPQLAAHGARINTNPALFARVDALHAQRNDLRLDPVQTRLIERQHVSMVRAGARLDESDRNRVTALSEELASLQTRFSQNVLADESGWHLALNTQTGDTAGLPQWLLDAAASAAHAAGLPSGAHAITLSRSLITPFLSLSPRRDLRETAWRAWMARGENDGPTDNRELIATILARRFELAQLHGYATFSDYQLADTMAKTPAAVGGLLNRVWAPARSSALAEYEELSTLARADGIETVEAWDWRYYAEQVRRTRYELDDDEVKPYFSLDSVLAAAFDCAQRLFGITFEERNDITSYHPDVRVFEVHNGAMERVGVFFSDNYARPTKRSGAWMSSYRLRADHLIGDDALPVIANHNNFAQAAAGSPTLLSLDDARTLFHEFGHGLHGLLSTTPYQTLAGTAVLRDFVELPSQLFEHWILEPEVLRRHARHVTTGEVIPDSLIERIERAAHFNQGFETVEYTSCALVDLALHQRTAADGPVDLDAFEREQLADLGMPPAMVLRHRLPHFSHLFASSAYASAYYVYMWAEVLDADAYDAFVESGSPFDAATAERLHRWIYSSGNTVEPSEAYRAFRGRDAGIEPLLRGRGLLTV